MPAIRGTVDRVDTSTSCVQVKAPLSESTTIRGRVFVTAHMRIVRDIERIDLSSLCVRESAEISYHHGCK
ncbi:hypothetical protein COMA1_20659 [Candidatus Nitrospira nitrosa]|uniref:Uncharacterized protein n=1 Tax=Candidatus Nitrospira nitrosa TaxID=1742972 RepID=A0A0S4LGV5_9BACT|nr:hypothetical protein [Candidatus Nitrospira nitrosa]CUS36142.1 hypothetical protein COMA1_20659 [Candidatus Nitrospira nitrosa]